MSDEKVVEMPKEEKKKFELSIKEVNMIVELCDIAVKSHGLKVMPGVTEILKIFAK